MKMSNNETSIRVQHKDGSVGMLLTDIDGKWATPTGVPIRWLSGAQSSNGDALVPVKELDVLWSVKTPADKIRVSEMTF